MSFRIGYFCQCQTIYHAKIYYQPKNYFPSIKNTRFTASPVLEVLDAPYCTTIFFKYLESLLFLTAGTTHLPSLYLVSGVFQIRHEFVTCVVNLVLWSHVSGVFQIRNGFLTSRANITLCLCSRCLSNTTRFCGELDWRQTRI